MKNILVILVIIAAIYSVYYYDHNKAQVDTIIQNANNAKNTVVQTTTSGIDTAIKNAISGVDKASQYYYYQNRSYGASSTSNICLDNSSATSLGSIISFIQTYTKAVSCTVDPNFPSKTFTIVAPSLANPGQYYCTDQAGFAGLIPDISQTGNYKPGISCK